MAVIAAVTFVVTVIGILVKTHVLDKRDHPVPSVFLAVVDLAFPAADLEKQKRDGYGGFVRAYMTAMIIPIISATCFITFWDVYAVEVEAGGACVDNFDCFPITVDGEYLQEEPVDNCTSFNFLTSDLKFENASNVTQLLPLELDVTYNCYRLVFRYAEGFGAYWPLLVSFQRSTSHF